MRRILIGLALMLAALPAWAQDLGTLDGTWEGSLGTLSGPSLSKLAKPWTFRIIIAGSQAKVFYVDKAGQFQEVKPGAFSVVRVLTNAIVLAIDSAQDSDGTWVETWDFAVTLKDQNTLIANFYRVVNNINVPLTAEHSKFTVAVAGELVRTR
jgi:hypothetical protein